MTHEEIRALMVAGLSEAEFAAIRWPVCNGAVAVRVNPNRQSYAVACMATGTHMHMTESIAESQAWWEQDISPPGMWIS